MQLLLLLQNLEYSKKNREAADKLINDKEQQKKRLDELKNRVKTINDENLSALAENIKRTQRLVDTASQFSENLQKLRSEKGMLESLTGDFNDADGC